MSQLHAPGQSLHKGRRGQRRHLCRERDHDDLLDAELIQQPDLLLEGGQIGRTVIWIEQAARVRLECHQDTGDAVAACPGDQGL